MINRRNVLAIATLMCLTLTPVDASSLTQMDIKKTSDNSVEVTFYTTETNSSPIVTRKSNNKYVMLMPNVSGNSASAPDLSSVKDIITNVDVKNIDDGMGGYTKITFITTKPLNIKTSVQKAAPISQEEKDAKALIAQVKTHPKQTVAPVEPKKEAPATKVTSSTGAPKAQNTAEQSSSSRKSVSQNTVQNNKSVEQSKTPAGQSSSSRKSVSQNTVQNNKSVEPPKTPAVSQDVKKAEAVKPVTNTVDTVEKQQISEKKSVAAPTDVNSAADEVLNKLDIKEIENIEKGLKSHSSNTSWVFVVLPLALLYMLFRAVRNSIQRSKALKLSFAENLAEKPHVKANYDDIINNSELNWQERYKKFVQESNGVVKNRKYSFIKIPALGKGIETRPVEFKKPSVQMSNKSYDVKAKDKSEITQAADDKIQSLNITNPNNINVFKTKRLEFENTFKKTPDIYKPHEIDISQDVKPEVQSEDEAIIKEFKEIKLKAFANPISLHTTHRNRVKKTLPKMPRMKEGRFVKLQETPLNTTSRRFKDANLKVSDLIKTGSQYIPEGSQDVRRFENEQNYIMSSIDEYFTLLDQEQARKLAKPDKDLSKRVAASLAQVKPSMKIRESSPARISNPIEKKISNENYMNGLIVKSGYNIDENRGFYLVSMDGVTALVGRIGEEIFVLKKFDDTVDKIQVRPDSENVYMVKAGGFKSLVDVDENKMGVLIEL